MSKLKLIAGFAVLLVIGALGAIIGGAAVAGGAHFIGFISMGTATLG